MGIRATPVEACKLRPLKAIWRPNSKVHGPLFWFQLQQKIQFSPLFCCGPVCREEKSTHVCLSTPVPPPSSVATAAALPLRTPRCSSPAPRRSSSSPRLAIARCRRCAPAQAASTPSQALPFSSGGAGGVREQGQDADVAEALSVPRLPGAAPP
jgi:hypothetical protein